MKMRRWVREAVSVPPPRRGEGERPFRLPALIVTLLVALVPMATAQEEAFRVRLVLLPGGTVSVSVDGGARFTTIGRIVALPQRQNSSRLPARTAVLSGNGMWQLQYDEERSVALAASGVSAPHALRTDIPIQSVLFRPLRGGAQVRLLYQEGRLAFSLPPGYRYRVGDVWVLQVLAPDAEQAGEIRRAVTAVLPEEAQDAIRRSVQRAEREKLPVVEGVLNLEVTARYAERVQFVFLTVDGYPVGTANVLPTVFRWDSTQVADGEYVLEARAVDREGRELALVRKRVLVRNSASSRP